MAPEVISVWSVGPEGECALHRGQDRARALSPKGGRDVALIAWLSRRPPRRRWSCRTCLLEPVAGNRSVFIGLSDSLDGAIDPPLHGGDALGARFFQRASSGRWGLLFRAAPDVGARRRTVRLHPHERGHALGAERR
jgi:hypothetical protein